MEEEFVLYTTDPNDRWDLIAWENYANPYLYPQIINANPAYRDMVTLPGGLELSVPVIDAPVDQLIGDELLPPWRRTTA